MQWINNDDDFSRMLQDGETILYIYVDWSSYASRDGSRIIELVERFFDETQSKLSFWSADVSDLNSPAAFIGHWLKEQEKTGIRMFPGIGIGAGSLVWIKNREV